MDVFFHLFGVIKNPAKWFYSDRFLAWKAPEMDYVIETVALNFMLSRILVFPCKIFYQFPPSASL
jgi:hypothetical protein